MKLFLVRLWEVIPGALTWLTLLFLLVFSFTKPGLVATIVLVYAIYWLIRVLWMTSYLVAGYFRYKREIKINWQERLRQDFPNQWQQLWHLVIVPTYKEDISILHHTLEAIARSRYPTDRLIVVVAFEGRDKDLAPVYQKQLMREYEHRFGAFLSTVHPADIAGEVRGKGPNITWAGREAKKLIDKQKIPYEQIITTTLDADNRVDPQYFANLTWAYLHDNDPVHKSFQPLPLYFNNIWQVPLPVRLTALSSSFWQIIQTLRPHHARNFAAHAQSFAALIQTDFWSVKTVVEDGHQYWRSFFKFDGGHQVVPLFVPVYMDAVQGDNLIDTFKEQYLQRRRWYWGVSDVPFVFEHAYGNKKIPFWYKWLQFGRLLEAHYSLATQSFILLIGWLPLFAVSEFRQTVIGYNFPTVYRILLSAAWVGLVANIAIAANIIPPRPGKKIIYIAYLIRDWIFTPVLISVTAIVFSALPAIDSQTRLMLKKPFTVFNVTKKAAVAGGIMIEHDNAKSTL